MRLLFVRNQESTEAMVLLAEEGIESKSVLIRNGKYPGADPRELRQWRGEPIEEVILHHATPADRAKEIEAQAQEAGVPFRVLAPQPAEEPEPEPEPVRFDDLADRYVDKAAELAAAAKPKTKARRRRKPPA